MWVWIECPQSKIAYPAKSTKNLLGKEKWSKLALICHDGRTTVQDT